MKIAKNSKIAPVVILLNSGLIYGGFHQSAMNILGCANKYELIHSPGK